MGNLKYLPLKNNLCHQKAHKNYILDISMLTMVLKFLLSYEYKTYF